MDRDGGIGFTPQLDPVNDKEVASRLESFVGKGTSAYIRISNCSDSQLFSLVHKMCVRAVRAFIDVRSYIALIQ